MSIMGIIALFVAFLVSISVLSVCIGIIIGVALVRMMGSQEPLDLDYDLSRQLEWPDGITQFASGGEIRGNYGDPTSAFSGSGNKVQRTS